MRQILVKVFMASLLVISLSGCGEKSIEQKTDEQRNVTLTNEEKEQLLDDILLFIENNSTGKELKMFSDDMIIENEDITNGTGVKNINFYVSSNAAYLQIGTYIYRFQFNSSNEIVSYIKYTVEA